MRAFSWSSIAAVLLLPALPGGAAAQFPAVVEGVVVEAGSSRPVPGATVLLDGLGGPAGRRGVASAGPPATTDGAGRFLLRSSDPGPAVLEVRHPGYAIRRLDVELAHGERIVLRVALDPVPLEVAGLGVTVRRQDAGGFRVQPGAGASAGRSAAELIRDLPGVTVRTGGPGDPHTVSIRGSAADEVLVLVDGVPLNDPLTGEADLSRIPAGSVHAVTVLPGARSARHGPRAQAGVVLVETRRPETGAEGRLAAGSLGRVEGDVALGGEGGRRPWGLSLFRTRVDGSFLAPPSETFAPEAVERANADLARTGLTASLESGVAGGEASLRLRAEESRRGLPGQAFNPSRHARQRDRSTQLAATWRGDVAGRPVDLRLHAAGRWSRVRDPEPPAGLPYDLSTRSWRSGLRSSVSGLLPAASPVELEGGLDLSWQRVRGDALDASAPGSRFDAGLHLTGAIDLPVAGGSFVLSTRVDRAGTPGRTLASHDASLSFTPLERLSLHLAHRSAFAPPALADQFFRAGVGVRPNPDLRGERVPSEVEGGVSVTSGAGPLQLGASLTGYAGDVDDMIVWAPDFRFVWSPRNVDVRRRGLDASGEVAVPVASGRLSVRGSWSLARVTYDRGDRDDRGGERVQVLYRPRHTGSLGAAWERGPTRLSLDARYLGLRYPVPAAVNALPGFWSADLSLTTRVTLGAWSFEPTLRVDRVTGVRDSMIFGYPDPGRRLLVGLGVRRDPD